MNLITFLCSVVIATIISLATFFMDMRKHKQDTITQSITTNRIEWISNVRTLMSEFLCAYIDKRPKEDLVKLMCKVRLYFYDESTNYSDFYACMKKCCENPYSEENAEELIQKTQIILKGPWVRIKIEGGQSKEDNLRIKKLVDEYMNYLFPRT